MKNDEYVTILDCYFKVVYNQEETKYIIGDEDLARLVERVHTMERVNKRIHERHECYYKYANEKINELKKEKHVYKIELGRCVRKLTRIYKFFDTIILYILERYPLTSSSCWFYLDSIEALKKEIKNV